MEMTNESEPHNASGPGRRGIAIWLGLVGWIVICFAAAAAGAPFAPDDWYAQLNRPSFAPPDYLFGPVWSFLYLSMAVAVWLVWKSDRLAHTWPAIALFVFQLALNSAWTWLFFGLHRIDWAVGDIVVLLGSIVATTVLFFRHRRAAGLLMIPYIAWVTLRC